LGDLDAECIGSDGDRAHGDAGDEAIGLTDDDGGERLEPAEDSEGEERAEGIAIEGGTQSLGMEKNAKVVRLPADGKGDDHEGRGHDGGDGVAGEGESGGEEQRCKTASNTDGDSGSVTFESTLRADENGFEGAKEDDEAGDANGEQAVSLQGRIRRGDVGGDDRGEDPGEEGDDQAEDQVDAHGAAHGAKEGLRLTGSAVGGDLLDVSVAESGGNDGAGADKCGGNGPDSIAGHAEVVEHDRGNENHTRRPRRIVENAEERVGEMSLECDPHLCNQRYRDTWRGLSGNCYCFVR